MNPTSNNPGPTDPAATDPTPTDPAANAPFQALVDRDVVRAGGRDAATFLQGQLSQDVAGLAPGASSYSLLLQPQGKVDAWLRVTRLDAETFLLDVDRGWGDAIVTRLNRFKLRTACDLERLEGWTCWAVRGLDAAAAAAGGLADEIVVDAGWPGLAGFDRLGPQLAALPGIEIADTDRYVAARVAAGVPAMGSELDESTIPAEAGAWIIERSVSFTKGCYTGQELVARVDSRGSNTPRKLRLVRGVGLTPGATLQLDGESVGTVTTATAAGTSGLAYLKRSVDAPAVVALAVLGGAVDVQPLPGG